MFFLSIYIYVCVSTTAKKFDLSIWLIIAQGSSFCHHPCERQDQEESCQISTVPSHPASWGCASCGIHWSISCWFSRTSRILEALVFAQATSPSCSSRPPLAIGIGGDDAKYSLAGSKVIIICMSHSVWPQVSPWITPGKNSYDGWELPSYEMPFFFFLVGTVFLEPPLKQYGQLGFSIWDDMAINRRLLLAGLRYEISLGYRSLDPIYRVIAWSFNDTCMNNDYMCCICFSLI